jgi:diguanylate cyclase (GGDEF)-like protein/PAS domain S-box-containing protein
MASRISASFASLYMVAVGILFALWYFGWPSAGLIGERDQRVTQAMRGLEARADLQRGLIVEGLKERRGDVMIVAENTVLAKQMEQAAPAVQNTVLRLFDRWQRAYPDRFERLSVLEPDSGRVLASSDPAEVGQLFGDAGLLQRASRLGVTELVVQLGDAHGGLAVMRQIRSVDDEGYVSGRLTGILVARIGVQQFVGAGFQEQLAGSGEHVQRLLLDASGRVLAQSEREANDLELDHAMLASSLRSGFEGSMLQSSVQGEDLVVVYRPVQLSASQGWTLVHIASKREAMAGLSSKVQSLAWAGLTLSVLALALIRWMAYRLTRPLKSLAGVAEQLGGGDHSVRVRTQAGQSREVLGLAAAFNGMADAVQKGHQTLEAQVQARTVELQRSEARHRTLFEANADAVLVLDHEAVVDCNPAALVLFGVLRREDLLERHLSELSPPAQGGGESSLAAAQRCIEEASRQGSYGFEWLHQRLDDGETFVAEVLLSRVELEDQVLMQAVVRDVSARRHAEEQIRLLAFYDPLTNLPNRRLLMDRLEKAQAVALRHHSLGALLFVDLDNFKNLNDTLGHERGDQLLVQVAQRLTTCVRACDSVARLGGDEFVVMLEELSADALEASTQADAVGRKILALLGDGYQLASENHHSTPSIGLTLFGQVHEAIAEPLKRADLAMYQAKAAGKNTLRVFDPQMQAVVSARAAMEAGLRAGLGQGQFLLHYQAQVTHAGAGKTDRIEGAEVLVRWLHPQLGMVSPAEFIALAEDTGLILPLGEWVLETACQQLAAWAGKPQFAELTLAVNVSAKQFHQDGFVDMVLSVLHRNGARPQRLKLELTEGVLVANAEAVSAKMHALKDAGVGFSLDDFGTGYSSLAYLKRLPLDQLKIDQGFVRDILKDPNDAAIARMVVVLADSLGLAVIAEGVETEAQRDFLRAQGCASYQGYWFSRPLPLADFEALFSANRL